MESIKGGALTNLNKEAVDILNKEQPNKTQASWALRFIDRLDGILAVLSGMSTIEQVDLTAFDTFMQSKPHQEVSSTAGDYFRTDNFIIMQYEI